MIYSPRTKRKACDGPTPPCKQRKSSSPPQPLYRADTPMAASPPTKQEPEAVDRSTTDLSKMSAEEREQCYKSEFSNVVDPLKDLVFLSEQEAAEYPLNAEIEAAYRRYATFEVDVWVNYDAMAQRFFCDARAQDCGLLRLPPKAIAQVSKHEYSRVRFVLRTPFTRLGHVTFEAERTKLDVGMRLKPVKGMLINTEPPFMNNMYQAVGDIEEAFEGQDRTGLTFEELRVLAKCFCIAPDVADVTPAGWARDTRTFMNINRFVEHNSGYVEDLK